MGWQWTRETQPVLVNSRVPGLITQWRAPFEKGIEGTKRRHGKMTLAIINPTKKTLVLPKNVRIANYRPAKFIKEVGKKGLRSHVGTWTRLTKENSSTNQRRL